MIVPMSRVRIIGPRERLDETFGTLQDFGRVQLDRIPTDDRLRATTADRPVDRHRRALRRILDDARSVIRSSDCVPTPRRWRTRASRRSGSCSRSWSASMPCLRPSCPVRRSSRRGNWSAFDAATVVGGALSGHRAQPCPNIFGPNHTKERIEPRRTTAPRSTSPDRAFFGTAAREACIRAPNGGSQESSWPVASGALAPSGATR